jgi:hypothetical protein
MKDFDVTIDCSIFIKGICYSEMFRFFGKQLTTDEQAGHTNQFFFIFLLFGHVTVSEVLCLFQFLFLLWIVSVKH